VRPAGPSTRSPSVAELCEFIAGHRDRFGVAPICRALECLGIQIAPNTFHKWRARGPSKRALWDATITEVLAGYYGPSAVDERGRRPAESIYGSRKMWGHLNREGIEVARCTVERLMRAHGWQGVTRRVRPPRTTLSDPAADRAPDLVNRLFARTAPDELWVADFTYVDRLSQLGGRWCYASFAIDAFAGTIVGWQVTGHATEVMVEACFAEGVELRARQGHPVAPGAIHHSDAGTQYTAIRFAGQLAEAEFRPSIGTVGDAYDNALAETTIGLYKTECTRPGSPFNPHGFTTLAEVETATAEWVHWYNTHRLMHRLGLRPPAEAETEYYARHPADHPVGSN
jgi:putative transposase